MNEEDLKVVSSSLTEGGICQLFAFLDFGIIVFKKHECGERVDDS